MRPGAKRNLTTGCGIKFYCTVDDDFNLELTDEVPDSEVWNGVPIVD